MSTRALLVINTVAIVFNALAFTFDVLAVGIAASRHDTAGALWDLGLAAFAAAALGLCIHMRMTVRND